MNSKESTFLETDDLAQAGQAILSHLGILSDSKRYTLASHMERANYRAIRNWLTKYQPKNEATNLEKTRGFLESFYHLCKVDAREEATEIMLLSVNVVNKKLEGSIIEPFHLQLGRWGYYTEQIHLYSYLLGNWTQETAMICLNGLGLAHYSLGDYSSALKYHSQHLELAKKIYDSEAEQNALCNLGNVYGSMGQYPTANSHYEQALILARNDNDRQGESKLLGNLGVLQRLQGNFNEAIAIHQQHLHTALEIDDQVGTANALENLGVAHYYLGIYEIAKDLFQSSLQISAQIGDQQSIAATLGSLGNVSMALGDLQQSLKYYRQQLDISREIRYLEGEEKALGNIGTVYKDMGNSLIWGSR